MNIIIVRTKRGFKYAFKIQEHIIRQGFNCYIARRGELKQVIKKYNLMPGNTLIHSRTAGRITNKKLAEIEAMGFKIINSVKTLELTSNKYKANAWAAKNNIPAARTRKVKREDLETIKKLLAKYKVLVLKPIHSQGQGVFCQKIDSNITEKELLEKVNIVPGENIQVQEFIEYTKLIRVIVIDYKALDNAYTYDMPNQSWKCSVCLNPKIKKYIPESDKLKKLAEKTARAFKAQVNFIDFFEDKRGNFILNEINTACSLFIHERVTGVPIHKYIGNFLMKEVKKMN
ncbi:MAG: hypothetical protein WC460_02095 [Patescibacteria group bacterium]